MRFLCLALAVCLSALPALAQDCDGVGPIIAIRADGMPVYTHQEPEVYATLVANLRPRIGDRPADFPILAVDTRTNTAGWISRRQLKKFVDVTEAALR